MIKVISGLLGIALLVMLVSSLLFTSYSAYKEAETSWERHAHPQEAGWSSDKLEEARQYFISLNSTAAIGIYKGKILFEWGDTSKNTNVHSVRKSFLSALYGIYEEEGKIQLDSTLEELDIGEGGELTEKEREAKVEDLLTSRSGVFLPAGEESRSMIQNRPPRESQPSGTYFYYNNWDFNALGTIFNLASSADVFQEFQEKIAEPIGMENFTLNNTMYRLEENRSYHPSYLFSVSARDMARFGQLYLQNGEWEGEQIVPEEWIERSTKPHAETGNEIYDYGYLWWVAKEGPLKDAGLYSAVGRHGQSIDILPEYDFVFVHRVDSTKPSVRFLYRDVSQKQRLRLLEMVLDAKLPDEGE
ncbi:beta-lactamase family protein [Evansella sp. LMS18]|uniref:serine hydrolase domain-containing protein n=1 Tax=Evansella sp. LMS18 TaxID=2924033 RepID=UPI0020D087F0|nr:serine hydrolase [Evansella sp. LMS18]UTR09770.1 beta-lactamase family protein [Evansella sp. LMS18]